MFLTIHSIPSCRPSPVLAEHDCGTCKAQHGAGTSREAQAFAGSALPPHLYLHAPVLDHGQHQRLGKLFRRPAIKPRISSRIRGEACKGSVGGRLRGELQQQQPALAPGERVIGSAYIARARSCLFARMRRGTPVKSEMGRGASRIALRCHGTKLDHKID